MFWRSSSAVGGTPGQNDTGSLPAAGSVNAYPKVGPVVIREIMYHPAVDSDAEYIELVNIRNWFRNSIELGLSPAIKGVTLRYTTNKSIPTGKLLTQGSQEQTEKIVWEKIEL